MDKIPHYRDITYIGSMGASILIYFCTLNMSYCNDNYHYIADKLILAKSFLCFGNTFLENIHHIQQCRLFLRILMKLIKDF